MHILIQLDNTIPVITYGGTERVMWSLGKELSRMGHKVSFLVPQGSSCDFASIIPIDPGKEIVLQIPDGIDWDDYGTVDLNAKRNYYHFLGKAAWRVKNVKGAIDVVKALPRGERLIVLGGYRFNFKMGWRFTFTPKASFKGMVGGAEKCTYLQHSKGLIFPVRWDEPFGLAITESLYFGAPVFGTPYGSLPELVKPEVGFLTNSEQEMIAHLQNCGASYSPATCHEYARDLFNSRVMAENYLKKYEQVLNGTPLNNQPPQAVTPDTKDKAWIKK